MSTTPITTTELINASTDAATFSEFINSQEAKDLISRLGATYPTLVKAIQSIGFTGSEAWLTATTYSDFQVLITEAGASYTLAVPHTSGIFATDLIAGKWVLYTPGGLKSAAFADILGTVSESAGVPTGAIIERGSNANGEFVKFAEGTLICTHISSAAGFNLSDSSYFTWTFPHAFVTTFNGVGYIQRPSNDTTEMFVRTGTVSTGSAQNFAHSGSAGAGGTFILRAIGRWY